MRGSKDTAPPRKARSGGQNGANGGGRRLVIVESPAKARTIAGYLGKGYVVESSIGHIRDMPDKAAEIPTKYRKEPWARLGVDVDHGFEAALCRARGQEVPGHQAQARCSRTPTNCCSPLMRTARARPSPGTCWRSSSRRSRPGGWSSTRSPRRPSRSAVANPRELDQGLVDAYQTRRVLDRLYGYEVSPVLWKKVMPRLSAGRVQSVATRLVVARERERIAFRAARYWDLQAVFARTDGSRRRTWPRSRPTLVSVDGRRVAQGRDFAPSGELRNADALYLERQHADADGSAPPPRVVHRLAAADLADRLGGADFSVKSVERKPYRRSPYAPFRTTTLQQEASRKLGFSAKYTMSVAQRLYENGHITYMRTDSTTLSQTAHRRGPPPGPRAVRRGVRAGRPALYASKVKNAQEAHEAIRPAGDSFRTPAQSGLSGDELRLYELVWKRTVASQMKDATGESVTVRVGGRSSARRGGRVRRVRQDHQLLRVPQGLRGGRGRRRGAGRPGAPPAAAGRGRPAGRAGAWPRPSTPPGRRPATPRPPWSRSWRTGRSAARPRTRTILGTILDRGYVFKKGTALVPSFLAFAVITLLERHFASWSTTTSPRGWKTPWTRSPAARRRRVPWLRRFYFGADGEEGLKELVSDLGDIDARDVSSFPLAGTDIVVRVGRYGPYLERDEPAGQRARGDWRRTSSPRRRPRNCSPSRAAMCRSAPTRPPGRRSWPRQAGSART